MAATRDDASGVETAIGVGLIGAGFIADYHLAGLAGVPEAAVRVVTSRTAERARALANRFGIAEATSDLDSVLAREDIAAVVVTTPDDTHEAIASRALEAGKAVLLQKPMATTADACRRLIATAKRTGGDLQVSWMHRHFPEVAEAGRLLAEGAIGRVTHLRLRNATPGPDWAEWFFSRDRVGGGVVLQLGAHGIDLLEHLFGPIAALSAQTATLRPERRLADGRTVRVDNPDSAWAHYALASGVMASHEMAMIEMAGTDRFRLEIYGEAGTIWLRSERGGLALFAPERLGAHGWFTPLLDSTPVAVRHHRHWVDGLLGRRPPEDTAHAGLRSLLVAEAIARSSDEGRRVTMDEAWTA